MAALANVSPSRHGLHFKAKSKEMTRLASELSRLGSRSVMETPQLVVCGDQSAGKSSVIQRLCGVNLPRSEGTCTRCPMEIRLLVDDSENATWACKVSIRTEFDERTGQPVKPHEAVFIDGIKDKSKVEKVIRRAQKAILNPSQGMEQFMSYEFKPNSVDEADSNELKFTRNVVVLEILGADINLTAIDLPGIIHTTEKDEDRTNVDLIRELTEHYMSKERAIIIITISCKVDMDNQAVYGLAKKYDPQRKRTIGVLTKPDKIEGEAHDFWREVMAGRKFPLDLRWHMVRNPTSDELKAGSTEPDDIEASFFSSSEPWRSMQLDGGSSFIGVAALKDTMSCQLTRLVEEFLPKMKEDVRNSLKELEAKLLELPEAVPPSKRQLALDRLLLELKTATEQLVDATGDSKAFLQAVNRINGDFTAKVMQSRPRFVLSQAAGGGAAAREAGAAENHGDDEQPAVEADYGADGESLGVPSTTSSMTGSISSGGRKRPAASMHGTRMTISDVKRIMEEEHSTELPGFVPYCGLVRIIKQFQDAWKEPAMCCLDQSKEELEKAAMQQVNRTFGRWPDLERIVKLSVVNHITACADTAEQRVKEQLEMEAVGYPMTLNDHYFRNSKEKMLAGVKEAMSSSSAAADDGGSGTAPDSAKAAQERAALAALAALGMSGLSASDLYGKLGASSSDDKVYETIATTMAYFKVASKRFVDYVPLCIRLHLLHAFRNKLFEHVREQLEKFKTGGEQPQTAADLIVDDKHTAATRQKLEDKRAQFEGIRRALATY